MLNQITKIIEQVGSKEAADNGVSSDRMSKVTEETKNSIISGFKNAVSEGNLNQITALFQGDSSVSSLMSNPLVSTMIGSLIPKLTENVGLGSATSKSLATAIIPKVLSMLITNSKDSKSGFNPTDLIAALGGSDVAGMLGNLGGLLGGDKEAKSGGNPLSSLKGLFK